MSEANRRDARRLEDRVRHFSREELVTLRQWIGDVVSEEELDTLDRMIHSRRLTLVPEQP